VHEYHFFGVKLITKLFLLIVIVSGFSPPRSSLAQTRAQKINRLLTLYNSAGQFNGAALVVENRKVIVRKGFGYANLEWRVPNTPDTKFRIGSITKSFTAILTLQLVQQGKLKLDGKITDYLPDFSHKNGDRITVNQLLTHTSGLPDYNNIPEFFRLVQSGLLSDAEVLKRISDYDLLFEPGTRFSYSNDGYRVLGAIIEKATAKSYEQVLQERILDPLGMRNTGYSSATAVLPKRAAGYWKRVGRFENAAFYEASPASGMYSTVDDLYLWGQALEGTKLLSSRYKDLMWQVSPYGNAYGWLVSKSASEKSLKIMSEGTVPGFYSRFVWLRKDGHTIILLTNFRSGTNYLPEIEEGITNVLYSKAYKLPKKSIAESLLVTINRQGAAAAVRQYRALKTAQPDAYDFAVEELNSLGYFLMGTSRVNEAIAIFKLNIESYPQSSNAYDSLGEAYMNSGDKARAILSYQKAIDLNPQNSHAVEMLKRLRQN
jgi:CubicO group peptidase (beta-lactamase class C family)